MTEITHSMYDYDGGRQIVVRWTWEPPRERTVPIQAYYTKTEEGELVLHNKPIVRKTWPGMAFATTYYAEPRVYKAALAVSAYTALAPVTSDDSLVFTGGVVCLGDRAADDVRNGRMSAQEAYWMTAFSHGHLADMTNPGYFHPASSRTARSRLNRITSRLRLSWN